MGGSIAARRRLLGWYRRSRRDLPWRRTTDPYAIWVSEIMLQQTRVKAAIPYYERFLARFPDVSALARATKASDNGSAWLRARHGETRSLNDMVRMQAELWAGGRKEDSWHLRAPA